MSDNKYMTVKSYNKDGFLCNTYNFVTNISKDCDRFRLAIDAAKTGGCGTEILSAEEVNIETELKDGPE